MEHTQIVRHLQATLAPAMVSKLRRDPAELNEFIDGQIESIRQSAANRSATLKEPLEDSLAATLSDLEPLPYKVNDTDRSDLDSHLKGYYYGE